MHYNILFNIFIFYGIFHSGDKRELYSAFVTFEEKDHVMEKRAVWLELRHWFNEQNKVPQVPLPMGQFNYGTSLDEDICRWHTAKAVKRWRNHADKR